MELLTFFALPVATLILAVVLEKIVRVPVLTAAAFFAVYLIVCFTAFDSSFLIYVIVYTALAYIAAIIAEMIYTNYKLTNKNCDCNSNNIVELSENDIQEIAQKITNTLTRRNCRR